MPRLPNPYRKLRKRQHEALIDSDVIARAHACYPHVSKSRLSRALAGITKKVHPEILEALTTVGASAPTGARQ